MAKKKALSRAEAGKECKPFEHMNLFTLKYLTYKETSFEFILILLIAQASNNSLFFVALGGLFNCCISPSSMDKWFKNNRMIGITRAMVISIVAGSLCIILCLALLLSSYITGQSTARLLYVLPVLFAIHTLSDKIIQQCIENDWCQVLSDGDKEWLSRTKSRMQRLDMIGACVAPMVIGTVATQSLSFAAILFGTGHVAATLMLWRHLSNIYVSFPTLASSTNHADTAGVSAAGEVVMEKSTVNKNESALMALAAVLGERDDESHSEVQITFSPHNDSESNSVETAGSSCAKCCNKCMDPTLSIQYFTNVCAVVTASGCVGTILASSCLYLSILSMGSIMTVYLRWTGLSDYGLGILRGLSVVAGGLSGMSFSFGKERCNDNTFVLGKYALLGQAGCACLIATCVYMLIPFIPALGDVLIGFVILFSQFLQTLFQLSAQDMVYQKTSDDNIRKLIMSFWHNLTSICTVASFIAAILLHSGATFSYLAIGSAGFSLCGSFLFMLSPICCKLFCQAFGDKTTNPHGSSNFPASRANKGSDVVTGGSRADFTVLPMSSEHGHRPGQKQENDEDEDDDFEAAMRSGGTLKLPSAFTIHHPEDEDDD